MLNIILRNVLSISTMLTLSTLALSQVTYTTIGDITFGSDGSTAQTIGGTTFINSSAGVTSTINKVGNVKFINSSDGTSATVNKIGNTTFINSSTGSSTTIQKIGNTIFSNSEE